MLEIRNIYKEYITGDFKQNALNNVSVSFRKSEFVSILGPSGSGKTSLLNIIGGLDVYTSGDLIINGISTKKYTDRDWDVYRNHKIGFVFQNYNLIMHQSILANVELALTLSGVPTNERKKRAIDALKQVGLIDHMNKRPNQLSGGQMQRVAIARALVNNPDILLADEPTGALDSKTSVQIMEMLKEVAKDKLVIMVTHNKELANTYSTRVIELQDGEIKNDTDPYYITEENEVNSTQNKRIHMNFKTALSLSLNNLLTKKGRTILTSIAGSIGIIGIALILSLSNGVQNYINRVQKETLTSYPITIDSATLDLTTAMSESIEKNKTDNLNSNNNKIYSNNVMMDMMELMSSKVKSNNLEKFKKYLIDNNSMMKEYVSAISYEYDLSLQLFKDSEDEIVKVNPNTVLESIGFKMDNPMYESFVMSDVFTKMIDNDTLNKDMYELVSGSWPKNYNEVLLVVDKNNKISDYTLYALGLMDQKELEDAYKKITKGEQVESVNVSFSYDELVNKTFKLLLNTDYYKKVNGIWIDNSDNEKYLKEKLKDAPIIKVVGIIKPSEGAATSNSTMGQIMYLKELEEYVINKINDSDIVKEQKEKEKINVLTGLEFSDKEFNMSDLSTAQKQYLSTLSGEELADMITKYKSQANATYESVLKSLGAVELDKPTSINIYAKDFESKEAIKNVISNYNDLQEYEADTINYSDLVGMLMSSVTNIVDMISYVLIGFVSISLVVSSIMIGIITYISVLERTKEIGILRAIGASKKDISRVFNAETFIIGLAAGIFGILFTLVLNVPINIIIRNITGVSTISSLPLFGGIFLIVISMVLTIIAGIIPSKMASNKEPVEALRSE